jgi:hypothetical protein
MKTVAAVWSLGFGWWLRIVGPRRLVKGGKA